LIFFMDGRGYPGSSFQIWSKCMPNKGVQLTAYSVRSAPASVSSRRPALCFLESSV
jgi:hypothetical protein